MVLKVEKILREASEGTKIYVPIRNAPRMSYEKRFWEKVIIYLLDSFPALVVHSPVSEL